MELLPQRLPEGAADRGRFGVAVQAKQLRRKRNSVIHGALSPEDSSIRTGRPVEMNVPGRLRALRLANIPGRPVRASNWVETIPATAIPSVSLVLAPESSLRKSRATFRIIEDPGVPDAPLRKRVAVAFGSEASGEHALDGRAVGLLGPLRHGRRQDVPERFLQDVLLVETEDFPRGAKRAT